MTNEFLEEALSKATNTKVFLSEEGALKRLPEVVKTHFKGATTIIIADENTWQAAGEECFHYLREGQVKLLSPYIFPGIPLLETDHKWVEELIKHIEDSNAIPIAVGSGTINDLVKLTAYRLGTPYIVVATAPSVDGYAAAGAALLTNGVKMTHPCDAPLAIIGESSVLANAPNELKSAGYADLLAKIPAGADWIVADYLGEDPINQGGWNLAQGRLREFLSLPVDWDNLFIGLTLCGLAMQYQRDSRPVSGGEHLLSHIWEMEGTSHDLHGHKVGIGTLITTALYTFLFNEGVEGGEPLKEREELLNEKLTLLRDNFSYLGDLSKMEQILKTKYSPTKDQAKRRELLMGGWPQLKTKLAGQLFTYEETKERLLAVGAPTRAEEIGLTRSVAIETVRKSQLLRTRYTILDVVDDLGLMERAIDYIGEGREFL
ncbi:MAG: sn-glycerol-1-phosphate dehydrogenase [Sphaerochaetaceae bacterium]|jgi:glycerol-1-phosphate dehydrogenase [NAD(P)+]|nr:sn-glycerol-1-phosphate dehydrogenase [Sphaerochaetaceae bacterium]HHU88029.1 sn-glycerol-1-phosphate dehydrogenase [Spirochaetales bacterium]